MTLPVKATTLTQGRPKHMENKNSTTNSIVRLSTNDPCCYCYCQKMTSRRKQIICWSRRLPCRRFLFARYASTVVVLSMVLLLASAQDLNNNQPQATASPSTNSFNTITEVGSHILNTTEQNENITLLEAAVSYANKQTYNVQSNRRSSIKGLNMMSMPTEGYTGDTQSVSMNRNSLISGDSLLQRQLREKAKQDSLESIKLHILMRLNLKKLPNITKPIAVPQNILENFYKTYNASQKTKNSLGYGYGNQFERPSSTIVTTNADEIVKKPDTGNNHNSEFDHLSDDNSSSEMQSDDTNAFNEDNSFVFNEYRKSTSDRTGTGSTLNANNNDDELDDSILSHINSIYVFPEKNKEAHVRHSRKSDVLRFNIDTAAGYSDISYITLHLYLRGLDWINIHQPKLIDEIKSSPNKDITVTLQRAIRRVNSTNYTHRAKVFEFRHKIPSGIGQWVNVDLKPLFNGAGRQAVDMLFTSGKNQTQEIFIKGVETWMRPLIVTTDSAAANNPLTVHIEIGSQKKHRRKRSVFMDCTENDHDMRCCRYPLKVNFTSFGWHFVVAPTSFDAYFCSGDCRVGYLEQYPHTHLAALTTSATPCCSPTKMSSLSLLYFDDNHNLVLSVIPNMSVEGCSCS